MKHKIFLFMLCLVLLIPVPVQAAVFQDVQYVVDQADILTDEETTALNSLAADYSAAYGVDILIATVEDMNGESAESYAVSLNGERSWWDSDNAILFLLAMEEREWYIATFGEAIYIFTDYGLDQLGEAAIGYFSEEYYYEGFDAYLNLIPSYFTAWENSDPIDKFDYDPGYREEVVYYEPARERTLGDVLPVSLLVGIAAALICLFAMRAAMNTKRRQRSAADYMKQDSFSLRTHQDIFLYSNVSKTRRQQNTGSHGGGSSVHRSSGGRSHGGRGGRF